MYFVLIGIMISTILSRCRGLKPVLTTKLSLKVEQQVENDKLIFEAMQQYQNLYNQQTIATNYKIPIRDLQSFTHYGHPNIGEIYHKTKLGKLYSTKAERTFLSKQYNIHVNILQYKFELFVKAIHIYMKLHDGKQIVPRTFIVPSDDSRWPFELWGIKLGLQINTLRNKITSATPTRIKVLENIGFHVNCTEKIAEDILLALRQYKSHFGNLKIPYDYVVPHDDKIFDEKIHGLKLGRKIGNIKYRGDFPEYHKQFEAVGLCIEANEFDDRHWDHIYSALIHYKLLYNHVNVPCDFEIPDNKKWPENLHGLKLGYRVRNIRYRGDFIKENPEKKKLLNEIGFLWRLDGSKKGLKKSPNSYNYKKKKVEL